MSYVTSILFHDIQYRVEAINFLLSFLLNLINWRIGFFDFSLVSLLYVLRETAFKRKISRNKIFFFGFCFLNYMRIKVRHFTLIKRFSDDVFDFVESKICTKFNVCILLSIQIIDFSTY